MTIYLVDITQYTHTCPGDAEPHPVDIHRQIVAVIPGGECRTPVTIRAGNTTATIACGRHEPADRRCGGCRTIISEHHITTVHLAHVTAGDPPGPAGLADQPCAGCRQPLAAVLADTGHHFGCTPRPQRVAA